MTITKNGDPACDHGYYCGVSCPQCDPPEKQSELPPLDAVDRYDVHHAGGYVRYEDYASLHAIASQVQRERDLRAEEAEKALRAHEEYCNSSEQDRELAYNKFAALKYKVIERPTQPEPRREARINCKRRYPYHGSCGEFNCDTCHPIQPEQTKKEKNDGK